MHQTGHFEERIADASARAHSDGHGWLTLPFLRNTWYIAGWSSEFEASTPAGRTIIDKPIVLYRKRDGALVALEDRCAHRWAPLSRGRIEGDELRCMYHGLKFGAGGRCVEAPGQDRIAKTLCVRTFPVIEKYRLVWIWLGDPALADPSLIPNLGLLDQSWRLNCGHLDYEANYSLISDNLLDLSHLAFLHEKTLGRPVETTSASRPMPRFPGGWEAKPLASGVRIEGWLSANSTFVPKRVREGDLWSRVDFLVPGIYISHGQVFPCGTAEECNGLAPGTERSPLSDGISIQAVTPMVARKTRYFVSHGYRPSDMEQEESDAIWAIVLDAFSEDMSMIQAQQKMIDDHPARRMGGIAADRGLVLFRNLMKKLLAGETALAATEEVSE